MARFGVCEGCGRRSLLKRCRRYYWICAGVGFAIRKSQNCFYVNLCRKCVELPRKPKVQR